jgi:hypothetical protein
VNTTPFVLGGLALHQRVDEVSLVPSPFHGAPAGEAAPHRIGQNSCADNELAGAPRATVDEDGHYYCAVTL